MATEYRRTWENKRAAARSVSDESRDSYYGVPTIRKPHWKWMIIIYFFLGGISGASYVVAAIANWLGGAGSTKIVRAGRYLSFATIIPGTLLLIADLKRPARFFYMLRILKLRSPMSVGSWGLTGFGLFTGIAAAIQLAQDGLLRWLGPINTLLLRLPARLIGLVGSAFGFFVAGYTGVLLAATAVPLWAKNALLLGPLFISSALSNATAAITLMLSLTKGVSAKTLKRLEQLDLVAMIAELGLILAIKANTGKIIGKPLREGTTGAIHRWGVLGLGITAPLLIQIKGKLTGKTSRLEAALSSIMILAGGFLMRYVMVMGGRESADDPRATFEYAKLDG